MNRVFILSPASCRGQRARLLFNERAAFEAARRLRSPEGLPLGDAFAFLVLASIGLAVVATLGIFRLRVDTNHISFFSADHPLGQSAAM